MSMPADFESLQPEAQALVRDQIDKQIRGDEDWTVTRKKVSEAIAEATKETAYEFKGTRGEIIIPSAHVKEGLPAWVYTPANCPQNPPILVFFHGGGWVIGSLIDADTFLKMLTDTVSCIIVSVDYRLAPEHKYPAAIDDAETAAKWVLGNKESVGGSRLSKVGVIGDSAGGHLSACVSHDVPGIAFQVLIYPVTDMRIDTRKSYKRYADGYVLTTEAMYWFVNHFLHNEAERSEPRASPILRTTFNHLPPALYVAATHDVLFDEGMEYAQKLKEAGVAIETLMLEGTTHCSINFPMPCPDVIYQQEWGGRSPDLASRHQMSAPGPYVIIIHTGTRGCNTEQSCKSLVREIQNHHMDKKHWADIGYNFLIGEDGNVYAGRGYGKVGAHSGSAVNRKSLGIAVMGDFRARVPNAAALDAMKNLIACGVKYKMIPRDYILKGHRDVISTQSPGDALYGVLQNWPHYDAHRLVNK